MQTLTLRTSTLSPMWCTESSIHTLSTHYNPKELLFAQHLRLWNFLDANFLPILKIAPTSLPSIYCEMFVNHQYILLMPVMLNVYTTGHLGHLSRTEICKSSKVYSLTDCLICSQYPGNLGLLILASTNLFTAPFVWTAADTNNDPANSLLHRTWTHIDCT